MNYQKKKLRKYSHLKKIPRNNFNQGCEMSVL